jgi:branched-chain amino acid transport system ATP-binding protein
MMPTSEAEPALAQYAEPLLVVRGLVAGYGRLRVLNGVDLTVGRADLVALLGPNGAGKSTLLCAIAGLLPRQGGQVVFDGRDLAGLNARDTVRLGIGHVIQDHRVFTHLSVTDNLLLGGYDLPRTTRLERVEEAFALFPELAAKRHEQGGALSGGQQQMLAVAQGLIRRPGLLMLDEPSAGLSPVLVDRVLAVARTLRTRGTSVLLVEQSVQKSLNFADRAYVMAGGRIVLEAATSEPDLRQRLKDAYFGLSAAAA